MKMSPAFFMPMVSLLTGEMRGIYYEIMRNENDSNLDLSLENEQRVYCNSYDELVRGLAKKMEVDKVKLFPTEEENFDFEDIQGWIGLVDFQNREVPDIMVNLSADKGMNVFRFNVKDVKPIEDKDEKETKEQWITRTAITDAKMKVIEGVAEDVYPAVAFQIADYRKEIENIREEILHNKNERLSFEDILEALPSLPSSKKGMMGLATTAVVASMILAACMASTPTNAYEKTATQPAITEVSPTYQPTDEPILTPSIEVTEVPTLQPTETAEPTKVLKYPEYSRFFQPEVAEHFEGMDIPMDIGLAHAVVDRTSNKVTYIDIAEDIVPMVANYHWQALYLRYTTIQGNEGMTFEQFMEDSKKGLIRVGLPAFDETKDHIGIRPEMMQVNPAEGFSLTFMDGPLPIKVNDLWSIYYGVDEKGKLMVALNLSSGRIDKYDDAFKIDPRDVVWTVIMRDRIEEIFGNIANVEDMCILSGNIQGSCGLVPASKKFKSATEDMKIELIKLDKGLRGWMFDVRQ